LRNLAVAIAASYGKPLMKATNLARKVGGVKKVNVFAIDETIWGK